MISKLTSHSKYPEINNSIKLNPPPVTEPDQALPGGEEQLHLDPPCHRDGGAPRPRQDLHQQEALQVPQLDRDPHEGVQPWRVQVRHCIIFVKSNLYSYALIKATAGRI